MIVIVKERAKAKVIALAMLWVLLSQAGLLPASAAAAPALEQQHTVVLLVRHAEKVASSQDPHLSEHGEERAVLLAQLLRSAELEYVHSSDYHRTRETAAPAARQQALDVTIYDPSELAQLAQELLRTGGRHLVVGHSNTTPELVKLLGGTPGTAIDEEHEYDRLYVVTQSQSGSVSTVLMRYGRSYVASTAGSNR